MLQRQAGVEKANYLRTGVIELEATAHAPFEVKSILSVLADEIGFQPFKEIEVTVRGRIHSTPKGWVIKPENSEEVFHLAENEQLTKLTGRRDELTLRGKLRVRKDGTLVLTIETFSVGTDERDAETGPSNRGT